LNEIKKNLKFVEKAIKSKQPSPTVDLVEDKLTKFYTEVSEKIVQVEA